jgi:ELWxxDGT repeat protein
MLPNVVLFQGIDSIGNGGLWETDGTVAGTFELTGIAGAPSIGLYPVDLVPFNANQTIFSGEDASGLVGLWETDGTAAGTHELTGIAGAATTAGGLNPYNLTVYNGTILFGGYDATGSIGLWVSDGTAAGTHELTGIAGAATTAVVYFPRTSRPTTGRSCSAATMQPAVSGYG